MADDGVAHAGDGGEAPADAFAMDDGGSEGHAVDGKEGGGTNWWDEIKGLAWLALAVLGFHSFIAKPFYIPSESMLPGLLEGDRLIVTKYPYGYSFVSPTFHLLPFISGRLFGRMPERGDVVIVTPPGSKTDYIKRVIGLPGDRIQLVSGVVYLNGKAVERSAIRWSEIPVDPSATCDPAQYPGALVEREGKQYCRLPIVTETLPNGRRYDTVDLQNNSIGDNYGPVTVPANHVFLMGDNRDRSSDSRFPLGEPDLGLGGPVPWENIGGRAEFITFSLNGTESWNPLTWFGAFRSGRAGNSLHPDRVPVDASPAAVEK